MGDRALIQLRVLGITSPRLYLHWSGSEVPSLLDGLTAQMETRGNDLEYSFARLVGRACNMNGGDEEALSVGVYTDCTPLTEVDSQGDAGCFIYNMSLRTVYYGGGYKPNTSNSQLHWVPMSTPVTRNPATTIGEFLAGTRS